MSAIRQATLARLEAVATELQLVATVDGVVYDKPFDVAIVLALRDVRVKAK
jgi:hypothetical protein